jgi:hypothetical protein
VASLPLFLPPSLPLSLLLLLKPTIVPISLLPPKLQLGFACDDEGERKRRRRRRRRKRGRKG